MYAITVTLLAALLVAGSSSTTLGGHKTLSAEELKSDTIADLVSLALADFGKGLTSSAAERQCVEFKAEVSSATTQVVAGLNYDLSITFAPQKKTTDECKDKDVKVDAWSPLSCDYSIWAKLGDGGNEIKKVMCIT